MAHFLLLNGTPWRVHTNNTPEQVEQLLDGGGRVTVQLVPQDQLEPIHVRINTDALGLWAIIDIPDPS